MYNYTYIINDDDFHKSRKTTIGASDIATIAGINKYQTPMELWRVKTGRDEPKEGNEATYAGHKMECNILSRFIEEKFDLKTSHKFEIDYIKNQYKRRKNYNPPTDFKPFTRFVHPEYTWAQSHPDCLYVGDNPFLIEAKSGSGFANKRSDDKLYGYDFEDSSINGIPVGVYLQTVWQSFCSDIKDVYVCAWVDQSKWGIWEYQINQDIIDRVLAMASKFKWHIDNDKPPAPKTYDDIKALYPQINDTTTFVQGSEAEEAFKQYERKKYLKKKVKEYEAEIKDINNGFGLLMGENKYLEIINDGSPVKIAQQIIKTGMYKSIGITKLMKTHPEIYKILEESGLVEKYDSRYVL